MRARLLLAFILTLLTALAQDIRNVRPTGPGTGRRVALIIGNRAYANQRPLVNPENDAVDLADSLRPTFDVTLERNLGKEAMDRALADFVNRLQPGDTGLFYFSGHGLEIQGQNYLLPVDFNAQAEYQVKSRALSANEVLDGFRSRGAAVSIVILDACRDNPFRSLRSGKGGLATLSADGAYIAFAAAPGQTAADNPQGRNGLFTKHLKEVITQPGLTIDDVFNEVRERVFRESAIGQRPFSTTGLVGRFYFRGGAPVPAIEAPVRTTRVDPAVEAWNGIKDSKDPAVFEKFARAFPEHELAKSALLRAEALRPVARVEPALPPRPSGKRAGAVWIEPGSFLMGCSPGDNECDSDEAKPPKRVTIAKGFWMKETEVTQAEYERVIGANPSRFKGPNRPVESVDWNQAKAYCSKEGGRLPTAAEWEYAARAGTTGARYGDLGRIAWGSHNAKGQSHDVRGLEANAWGLYDMLGNVWEWTADNYSSTDREIRGGSWNNYSRGLRASFRNWRAPSDRSDYIGFRCAWEQNSI